MPEKATTRMRDILINFGYKVTQSQTDLFSTAVPSWYSRNKRDLPWRNATDPYKVWLSEVILQQTRVEQGLPYYHRFVDAFPDVKQLAAAPAEKVLKLWEGLGYYSRAHNLHAAAAMVSQRHGGVFPSTMQDLKTLKGVGDYTAAAISSICFGEQVPVIDGNVFRLVTRYFDIEDPVDQAATKRKLFLFLKNLMQEVHPGNFNQGMMELGSLICKPANPSCEQCPLASACMAYKHSLIDKRPQKVALKKVKTLHYNYLVIQKGMNLAVRKRSDEGIWKSMYELPFVESDREVKTAKQFSGVLEQNNLSGIVPFSVITRKIHLLSHRKIVATFWSLQKIPEAQVMKALGVRLLKPEQMLLLPFPVLISGFLKEKRLLQCPE